MITNSGEAAPQPGSECPGHEPLPEWFEDRKVQERIAGLIAKAAATAHKPDVVWFGEPDKSEGA